MILFGLLAGSWSTVTPVTRAPDETTHFDLIDHLARGGRYPDFDGLMIDQGVMSVGYLYIPGLFRYLTPDDVPPRRERSRLDQMPEFGNRADYPNQMPQHPPTYYWFMSGTLAAERGLTGSAGPVDREFHLLRWVNVMLVTPLPLLAWAAARRLGAGQAASTTASLVPLAVPQLAYIGGVINNDNMTVLFSAVAAVGVASVLRGSAGGRTAVLVGVASGLAMATKANAVVLLPWVLAAYGVQWWRGHHRRATVRAGATCLSIAAVLGGAWPARNLIRHGELFPSVHAPTARPAGFEPDLLDYLFDFFPRINGRFWGNFGYYEAGLGTPVAPTAALTLAVLFGAALWGGRDDRSERTPRRLESVVYLLSAVLIVGFVVVRAFSLYKGQESPPFVHGRYLFVAIVPMAVVAGAGAARLAGRWAAPMLLATAGILHVIGMRSAVTTWWAEPDAALRRRLVSMVRWSPWPEAFTYGLAALTAVVGVCLMWTLVGAAREPGSPSQAGALEGADG